MVAYIDHPPHLPTHLPCPSVFLAGTIDNGNSADWQTLACHTIERWDDAVQVFNPRRSDWDSTWEQDISNPNFKKQVTWELDLIDAADYILFHFEPGSLSPVTMLELGIVAYAADPTRIIVSCPPGFWRRGNVQIVCERFEIAMFDDLHNAIDHMKREMFK